MPAGAGSPMRGLGSRKDDAMRIVQLNDEGKGGCHGA